jgi:small-conductance mechanosensitive channel
MRSSLSDDEESVYTCSDDEESNVYSTQTYKLIKTLENFKMPPKKSLSAINKDAIQASNNELLTAINKITEQTSILREEVGAMNRQLAETLNRIEKLETDNANLNTKLHDQENRIKALENELKNQKQLDEQRIDRIEKQQEHSDQLARSNKIIIKGSCISYEAQNLQAEIVSKLSENLRIPQENLMKADFKIFGKMGKCILMTTYDANIKRSLFEAVRTIRPPNLSLNEFLTPTKAKLIYELRKIKYEQSKFQSVFSLNGNVYVTYTQGGPKTLINDISDVM